MSTTDVVARAAQTLLEASGEDVTREGLKNTPERFAKAWQEWNSGYNIKPTSVFTTFEDGAAGVDQMVTVGNISFWSLCQHHLAPFFGEVCVAYIPKNKILGLSKIPRLIDIFAKRLQVQEQLTNQIADAMQEGLDPIGVGVTIQARHSCVESRGIRRAGAVTITSALRGAIKEEASARAEFMTFVQMATKGK